MTELEQKIARILQEEFDAFSKSKYAIAIPANAIKRLAELLN